MSNSTPTLSSRISTKLVWNYRFLFRSRGNTIYHCCIQKSGSQWFKKVFNDAVFAKHLKLVLYSPSDNFITDDLDLLKKLDKIPKDAIISPLYIHYNDFKKMPKPTNHKAFFVARDPRDLIISNYFSLKYSHDPYHPYILKMRKHLNSISQEDGITELIQTYTPGINKTLDDWFWQKSENIKLIKFEDIFGRNQLNLFSDLLKHCHIDLPENTIKNLLEKYSFKNISGRKQGSEDIRKHYRKGTPGDWKIYFTTNQKNIFKKLAGDLLINIGYENNNDW